MIRKCWFNVLIFAILQDLCISDSEFGYDGQAGPVFWSEKYSQCAGKHQSPININILNVKEVSLPALEFVGFDDHLDAAVVKNNGHTVQIEVSGENQPRVRGGPLDTDYIFSQMHFHWGDNDTFGSEDKINHRSFPLELHMVFYKSDYGNVSAALDHSDGLTVLAFFYELDRHGHPSYDAVTKALNDIQEPSSTLKIPQSFKLFSLLPYDLNRYFTYRGSLTTPPCSEVVIWIDFEQPVRLIHEQIEAFREIKSSRGKIRHNFRPVQPLGDRNVYYNSDRYYYYIENQDELREVKNLRKDWRNSANSEIVSSITLFISLIILKFI